MYTAHGALPLARVLMTLGRARATGKVSVESVDRRAQLWLTAGHLTSIDVMPDRGPVIGDVLVNMNELDEVQHERLLRRRQVEAPVGRWLVSHGLVDDKSLSEALRIQAIDRLGAMLQWTDTQWHWRAGEAADDGQAYGPIQQCVVESTLSLGVEADDSDTRLAAIGALRLTSLGTKLEDCACRNAHVSAMWPLLSRGASGAALLAAAGHRPGAIGALGVLRGLGLVAPVCHGSHRTLLQKGRELSRGAQPHRLLGLSPDATPEQARRALRALVRDVHPDRFGPTAPVAVRRLSGRVTAALVQAEALHSAAVKAAC